MTRREADSILRLASQPAGPVAAPAPPPQQVSNSPATGAIQSAQPAAPSTSEWLAEQQRASAEQQRIAEEQRRMEEARIAAERREASRKGSDADCIRARSNVGVLRDAAKTGSDVTRFSGKGRSGFETLSSAERAAAIAENERFLAEKCRP